MNMPATDSQTDALAVLANGIIPAEGVDEGAASVNAGARLAEKLQSGPFSQLYQTGLETASNLSHKKFNRDTAQLHPHEVEVLIGGLAVEIPAFFKQLRMDVSALYLSDPNVWQQIGFPGPSIHSGGYPDFDQLQTQKITQLKEPLK